MAHSWILIASLCLSGAVATHWATSRDDVACGSGRPRVIEDTNGVFQSPNYPNQYPNNANCQWRLSASDSTAKVRMEFEDFSTESTYDRVTIYDGATTSGTVLATLDGTVRGQAFESSARSMYIAFSSDSSVTDTGFKGKFTTDAACFAGGERVLSDGSGSVSSPYFPEEYGTEMTCTWKIRGGSDELVVLSFEQFELEYEPSCEWDNLQVFDGEGLVGRFCGNSTPGDYLSSSNELTLIFSMDQSIVRQGFLANYQIVPSSSTPFISTVSPTQPGGSTTTSRPTAPPVNDDIIPPVMVVAINGTYRTDDGSDISVDCADLFSLALRERANEMLYNLYEIGYCADTDVFVATADTVGYVNGDTGRVKFDFNLLAGLNDTPAGLQSCGQDIIDFTTVFNHWYQPIIPQFPGCPKVIFDPEALDSLGVEVACPF